MVFIEDLTGKTFGDWTVLDYAGHKGRDIVYHCRCSCGKEKLVRRKYLLHGKSKSCGCKKIINRPTIIHNADVNVEIKQLFCQVNWGT